MMNIRKVSVEMILKKFHSVEIIYSQNTNSLILFYEKFVILIVKYLQLKAKWNISTRLQIRVSNIYFYMFATYEIHCWILYFKMRVNNYTGDDSKFHPSGSWFACILHLQGMGTWKAICSSKKLRYPVGHMAHREWLHPKVCKQSLRSRRPQHYRFLNQSPWKKWK